MGLFNFFKKDNNSSKQKKHTGNKIAVYTNSIPPDVKDLLFISDKPTVWNKTQNVPISFELSSDFEPSEIITSLPVRQGNESPLGYYPSYSEMSPEQRFKYLSFLTDITNPIDIGYVFVFYYGLERNIYMNRKFTESIDMIVKLQHYHINKSFLSYSNDALIFAAMKTRDPSILYKINLDYLRPELLFLVKGSFIGSFSPEDLMVMAKTVGFSNQRYIKSDRELFSDNLKKLLQKEFGRDEYVLDKAIKIDTKEMIRLMLANTSIPEREFQYPNLILSSKIHSDIYLLIKEAHEKTKVELAELRKKKPNKHMKKGSKDTKKKDEIYTPNDGLSLKERILLSKEAISDGFDEEMRGIELYKEGNLKDAEKWLLRSVKANFNAPALYEKLGILYRKQKRFSDKVEILKIGIKNAGNIPKLTDRLAKAIELSEKDKLKNKVK